MTSSIIEIENFIREGILKGISPDKKTKYSSPKIPENPFIKDLLNYVDVALKENKKHLNEHIDINKLKAMDTRNQYTIKKMAIDFLFKTAFKQAPSEYECPYNIIKLTKGNSLNLKKINKTQLVYIFLSAKPIALQKISKNTQIIDPTSGDVFKFKDYYLVNSTGELPLNLENQVNFSSEFDYSLGILVMDSK